MANVAPPPPVSVTVQLPAVGALTTVSVNVKPSDVVTLAMFAPPAPQLSLSANVCPDDPVHPLCPLVNDAVEPVPLGL